MQGHQCKSAGVATDGVASTEPAPQARSPRFHELALCSDEIAMVNALAGFAETALQNDSAVIVVARGSSHRTIDQKLRSCGLDLDGAIQRGTYVPLEVADVLSAFMVNGSVDETKFREFAIGLIVAAARTPNGSGRRVAAC